MDFLKKLAEIHIGSLSLDRLFSAIVLLVICIVGKCNQAQFIIHFCISPFNNNVLLLYFAPSRFRMTTMVLITHSTSRYREQFLT